MKYKLLVLDLDGTLTNSKKVITEHTRTTLIEAQKTRTQNSPCIRKTNLRSCPIGKPVGTGQV